MTVQVEHSDYGLTYSEAMGDIYRMSLACEVNGETLRVDIAIPALNLQLAVDPALFRAREVATFWEALAKVVAQHGERLETVEEWLKRTGNAAA